ncbi:MAG: type III secretion system export apparatus subunit SctS [Gammaproteobacteria bacterium]
MSESEVLQFTANCLLLVLMLSLPPILAATLVGTLVSLLQALTQIQEQNIAFVAKLVVIVFVLYFTSTWLGVEVFNYTNRIFERISNL